MPSKPKYPEVAERDGTSQQGRTLEALAPDYARVDEQTSEQLLAFARRQALPSLLNTGILYRRRPLWVAGSGVK